MKKNIILKKNKRSEAAKKFWRSEKGLLKKERLSKASSERSKGKTYEEMYGDRSKEIKEKIGRAQKGIPKTKEHNKKNSKAHKFKKRKPFSKEWRIKLGLATKGKTYEEIYGDRADAERKKRGDAHKGKDAYQWLGGISFEPYGMEFNRELKEIIRNRDRRKCKICEKTELENNKKLAVHHIDYNKKNSNPINLISLCQSCHSKTNHNRKYWIKYFNRLI